MYNILENLETICSNRISVKLIRDKIFSFLKCALQIKFYHIILKICVCCSEMLLHSTVY